MGRLSIKVKAIAMMITLIVVFVTLGTLFFRGFNLKPEVVEIDGHDYIESGYGKFSQLIHSEGCKNPKHFTQK